MCTSIDLMFLICSKYMFMYVITLYVMYTLLKESVVHTLKYQVRCIFVLNRELIREQVFRILNPKEFSDYLRFFKKSVETL